MGRCFSSRGEYILFADADGATRFSDIDKIFTSIKGLTDKAKCKWSTTIYAAYLTATYGVTKWRVPCIVCGSRAHMEEDSIASRSFFRTVLMYAFHFLVWLFTVRGIRDTQCGFKMFTRSAARIVFHNLHIERWAFDCTLPQKLKMPIDEVAVYWTEIEGSKVTPILSWIQMGMDLFAIWLRYTTGRWRLANKGD
ncbi:Dolichyl-phosphate beta-glucosyltransferase [Orchesella cincta]|uniref:Dolichyl-phosphate beta-glucosyltransferase n=1 Tax=Orchesella cincta TaxID=48709 RepID=A0A1D2N2J1_ORCCI|nr:Dolichyl-phosphate beta-glucosyltransferase [Orchesella cincta]